MKENQKGNNKYCIFSLETVEAWKNKDGETRKKYTYHDIICFKKSLCEYIMKNFKAGQKVHVEGSVNYTPSKNESTRMKIKAFKVYAWEENVFDNNKK